MRKFFALSFLVLATLFALYFTACNNNKTEPQADNKEDSLKKIVASGEYLANHVAACLRLS